MDLNVIRHGAEVDGPTIEEHDRDVDALVPCGYDAVAEAVEVSLVERIQVELRLPIFCSSGSGSQPWLRCHAQVEVASSSLGLEVLPAPEPDEVMAVLLEELDVCVVVVSLWRLGAVGTGTKTIVEVIPDV